jgi:hypothetical protein
MYFAPALLKRNNYEMPIGALAKASSSTGADTSCCALDFDVTFLFPVLTTLDVCSALRLADGKDMPSGFSGFKLNKSNRTRSAKGPSAKAADGTAGSAARHHGSRKSEDEGYYEGIAMVVSGPMYITNWDTKQDWELTGVWRVCCGRLMVDDGTVGCSSLDSE